MKPFCAGIFCSLALHALPALATYKCENAGKLTYSDTPCVNGNPIPLAPPAAASGSAAETAQRHSEAQKELERLEAARHKREAHWDKEDQRAAKARATKQKKCSALARRKRWASEDAASASGKSSEKAKRKARRMEEQFQADCAG